MTIESKKRWKYTLNEEFDCGWKGFAVLKASNGSVSCHYSAEIELLPRNEKISGVEPASLLENEPFLMREDICEYNREKLTGYLDSAFQEYCTSEPLYEPVAVFIVIREFG